MDAVAAAARAIKAGEVSLAIAGGCEQMTRAPLVMSKAEAAFQRSADVYDTTIGWRFVNPLMKARYGVDSMPETARERRRRASACHAQTRTLSRSARSSARRRLRRRASSKPRSSPVEIKGPQGRRSARREGRTSPPRHDAEALAKLRGIVRPDGSVTAGNASGVNDGAAALRPRLGAGGESARADADRARARLRDRGRRAAGDGRRSRPGGEELCERLGLTPDDFEAVELNEAFASQALACLRGLGLPDDAPHVNPNGGAIALGHPLGMSGARIAGAVALELRRRGGRYGLATMCVGVGQGVALAIERV